VKVAVAVVEPAQQVARVIILLLAMVALDLNQVSVVQLRTMLAEVVVGLCLVVQMVVRAELVEVALGPTIILIL
jgi:hypothetical protein